MSAPLVKHPDIGYIATIETDGYGDSEVSALNSVKCTFLQQIGASHSNNAELANSSAYVYLDINNVYIRSLGYRLEGYLFKISPFGTPESESWYKITNVVVGQRKLLTNEVNNVHAYLEKIAKPMDSAYVS